jgi:hypothetical protein
MTGMPRPLGGSNDCLYLPHFWLAWLCDSFGPRAYGARA